MHLPRTRPTAVSGVTRLNCFVVAFGCGWVVLAKNSEVTKLGIGIALGHTLALVMLSAISLATAAAGLMPTTRTRLQLWLLRAAGMLLIGYGGFAWANKGAVALPTAALAISTGLRFVEVSGELRVLLSIFVARRRAKASGIADTEPLEVSLHKGGEAP